jgi:CRISPR-associated protein Cst2
MAFVTGLLLIDAPASALNNLGSIPGERTDNTSGVKVIRTKQGQQFPYVSAQAFRYWLRETIQKRIPVWQAAPMYREEKIAYTDANPIEYWDDDLFGYMRAPSKKESAKKAREANETLANATETKDTITRSSPFRISTLVSIAPVNITSDFGTMSRHDGDPVPHEHQFYRTTLKGLFSLDLESSGTFSYRNKTGQRNLDEVRIALAQSKDLEHVEAQKAYRLPYEQRVERIKALFDGLSQLEGGAKQTLHYTDVMPSLLVVAVTKGGNHIFNHVVSSDNKGLPNINPKALGEVLEIYQDTLLSPIYVGWARGYLDEARAQFEAFASDYNASNSQHPINISHPRTALQSLVADFDQHRDWLD